MSEESLSGKVVVITGASSGFGKGTALQFAEKGCKLVLAARRENLLTELKADCEKIGAEAIVVPTDVSKSEEMENLLLAAVEKFGHVDVWVNNAGAAAVGVYTEVPLADHIQVVETDLIGTIVGSYLALQHFSASKKGVLINVASMIGKVPAPYYASYAAAKHGVVGLSAALRQELRAQECNDVHVCTVMPMAMDTPFFEHAANYSGHQTVPIPPLDDAQKVIDAIVNLATHPKDEVPVGTGSASNVVMHSVAPGAAESMMGTLTHKAQIEDAPEAASTAGAVRQPSATGSGIKDPKLAK